MAVQNYLVQQWWWLMDDVCAFHLAPYATHYVGDRYRWQQEDECYWLYSMLSKWRTIFSASQDTFHYGATSRLDSAKGCSAYYQKELKKFLCSLLHKLEGRNNTSNTSRSGLCFALCSLTGLCFQFCGHNYHLCTLQTLDPLATFGSSMYPWLYWLHGLLTHIGLSYLRNLQVYLGLSHQLNLSLVS